MFLRGDVERPSLETTPVVFVQRSLKYRLKPIVIAMWNRIVLMRMTTSALHRHSHQAGAHDIDRIADHLDPLRNEVHCPRTGLVDAHSQESCRDQVVDHLLSNDVSIRMIHQLVASELLE